MQTFITERPLADSDTAHRGRKTGQKKTARWAKWTWTMRRSSLRRIKGARHAGDVRGDALCAGPPQHEYDRDLRQQGQRDLEPGRHERLPVLQLRRPRPRAGFPPRARDRSRASLHEGMVAVRAHHRLRTPVRRTRCTISSRSWARRRSRTRRSRTDSLASASWMPSRSPKTEEVGED